MTRRVAPPWAALFLVAFAALPRFAAAERPSAPWRTIETAHFRVHFPAPFEEWAARAAASLEAVHPRVAELVGYAPTRKIDVLVSDPQADANGAAYPFLDRPRIELWASAPESESGLGDFRDWTEILVTHELAHVLHLTRPRNRPGFLERILPVPIGPVLLRAPRWIDEGYATLIEGALTGSGRPSSSYRAMILRRFALEGKLPSYDALDATSGWLGGSMAYLVGSSFLEWLEAREGKESLPKLWKRLASSRGGSFDTAFRAVFRRSPRDLYDRFRAEITARAVEQEKELERRGIVAGTKWQRLEGGTASLQVSPDGALLLARRTPSRRRSELAIWTVEPSEEERASARRRDEREKALSADPNEIVDAREIPERRSPKWTLPAANGRAAEDPRWLPGGRVLFTRREPDSDGVLHRDLFVWDPGRGSVVRLTRGADVGDADPFPKSDGGTAAAVAVRSRFGRSELVVVDLASGRVDALVPAGPAPGELWSHPRVSPDGSAVAVLRHREGSWRLVVMDVDRRGGAPPRELDTGGGGVFGPPAWSPDGRTVYAATDASGTWDLAAFVAPVRRAGPEAARRSAAERTAQGDADPVRRAGPEAARRSAAERTAQGDADPERRADPEAARRSAAERTAQEDARASSDTGSGASVRTLTRVTGGAFSPAPAPDGRSLFCLELTAKGVDVAVLTLGQAAPAPAERLPSILPPPAAAAAPPLTLASVPPSRPYRAVSTQVVRLSSGFTIGPDGQSFQTGVEGDDVVGRFHWVAVGAFGDAAGPRGGTLAGAWLGWPAAVRAQVFSALEKPGSQHLVTRPELDSEQRGGSVQLSIESVTPWGRALVEGFGAAARVEALGSGERFTRALAGGRGRVEWRRLRGRSGVSLTAEATGESGQTRGDSWSLIRGEARAAGILSGVRLSIAGHAGRTGGSPTQFDLFAIGGAASAILPPALERQRIESPALPTAVQLGERFEGFRADLTAAGSPFVLYAERWRAWPAGGEKPEPIRLEGIEVRLERAIPLDLPESLSIYAGLARVRSSAPKFDSTRGYAGMIYRP